MFNGFRGQARPATGGNDGAGPICGYVADISSRRISIFVMGWCGSHGFGKAFAVHASAEPESDSHRRIS